jgi:hypothetical protein
MGDREAQEPHPQHHEPQVRRDVEIHGTPDLFKFSLKVSVAAFALCLPPTRETVGFSSTASRRERLRQPFGQNDKTVNCHADAGSI